MAVTSVARAMRALERTAAPVAAAVTEPAGCSLGLRRVGWVRVVVGADAVRAEVVGIAHRLPVTVPVPMRTAAALARQGTPVSVCRSELGGRGR